MNGLRLDGLTIRHGDETLVRDISIEVREGESLCLIGASGSGKSLIAAASCGLLPTCMTAGGTVDMLGHRLPLADQPALRAFWHRHVCLLPQEPTGALAPLLGGLNQLRLAPTSDLMPESLAWLARFGLDRMAARRMPFALSGGMAQRLLAALATRTRSRVLIADEPTKGLDDGRRTELITLLQDLRDAGRAMLVISHDMDVVTALRGRVAVLEGGEIVEQGSVAQILGTPRSAFARACVAADPARWAAPSARRRGPVVAEGQGLSIGRDRKPLAGPLEFELAAGSTTALLGPSGCGKSTLGDTLLGLLRPTAGQVRWFGHRLDRRVLRQHRRRFQKLHQNPTEIFPPHHTIGSSLADVVRLPSIADGKRDIPSLLERLGLADRLLDRRPSQLSGGELQRFALARVLLVKPALLVADEPSSRLDPPVQASTLQLLSALTDEDEMSVLLITHDARIAGAMAEAVLDIG